MQLFDQNDRESIEWGLMRVFDYDVPRINSAIAAQVSENPYTIHILFVSVSQSTLSLWLDSVHLSYVFGLLT